MVTGAPKDLCRLALAGGALLVLACGHTEPFSTPPYGTTQPFDPTPPVRLTLNTGPDRGASWLPDGSGILYSAQQLGRQDFDVCLAELPPEGGTQRRLVCDLSLSDADLTNTFQSPAAAADGRLAFVRRADRSGLQPQRRGAGRRTGVGWGQRHGGSTDSVHAPRRAPPQRHRPDPVAGRDDRLDLPRGGSRRPARLSAADVHPRHDGHGTRVAVLDLSAPGGIAGGAAGQRLRLGCRARLDRRRDLLHLERGHPRVSPRAFDRRSELVHDFGAAGVARDVHVAGGRLTAVVGGRVHVLPGRRRSARSSGTAAASSTWWTWPPTPTWRSTTGRTCSAGPCWRPTGDRLVAEGYPLIVSGALDTTVGRKGDLYLFSAP